jgi:hypothetical protein
VNGDEDIRGSSVPPPPVPPLLAPAAAATGSSPSSFAPSVIVVNAVVDAPSPRGLHSFPFQLNLSSSVNRVTQLNS